MKMQKSILARYSKLHNNPPLREIAEDTGIQMTRVFRLFNGVPMKLEEFKIFEQRINDKLGFDGSLIDLAERCYEKFSLDAVTEIEKLLSRKLQLWELQTPVRQSFDDCLTA